MYCKSCGKKIGPSILRKLYGWCINLKCSCGTNEQLSGSIKTEAQAKEELTKYEG